MRSPSILAAAIVCLMALPSFGQLFPNAPWNRSAQSGCYTDSNGNTVCPGSVRSVTRTVVQSPVVTYPSVSSSVSSSVTYGSTGGAAVSNGSGGVAAGVPTLAPAADQVSVLSRRSDFRTALMAAAKESRQKGEISVAEYFKIAAMSRLPKVLANLEASIHEAAIEEGLATTQAPDWNSIIEFIQKLIPLIIQLIDLFGSNTDAARLNEVQYALLQQRFDPSLEYPQCDWIGTVSLSA